MEYYKEKKFGLANEKELIVRQPNVQDDLERFHGFIKSLPSEKRNYLRYDVTDIDLCRERMSASNGTENWRLFAEMDGEIVASGTLDREPHGWTRHVAELRCLVSPAANHMGIGIVLIQELVGLGSKAGIQRLFAEALKEQKGVQDKLLAAGFEYEATRRKYAKDASGRLHDVVIMSNDLDAVWKALGETIHELDLRYSRYLSEEY